MLGTITDGLSTIFSKIMMVVTLYVRYLRDAFTASGMQRIIGATLLGVTAFGASFITAGATLVVVGVAALLVILGLIELVL